MAKRIVAICLRGVGSVEVDHIGRPSRRDLGGHTLDEIAVRIDERKSGAAGQVLKRHRF
jgi:hypothetical protein